MTKYLKERNLMVSHGRSLFDRGYATGGAGNLSILLDDGTVLATPTGSSLGRLEAETLSVVSLDGEWISGDKPSKEIDFHRKIYQTNPDYKGIVHLHCTYLTALSCRKDLDERNALKAFTPYYVMRVGALPCIPYYRPGSPKIAEALAKLCGENKAILMANHGVTVMGNDFVDAVNNMEELEETAKLHFLLPPEHIRYLSSTEIEELKTSY